MIKSKKYNSFWNNKPLIQKLMITMVIIEASFLYIQAYKIFKDKSSEDISRLSYWILLIVSIMWVFYGKYIVCDLPVVVSGILYSIGTALVLFACYKYPS